MSDEHHHNHRHDHDKKHEHHQQGWLAYIFSAETRRMTAANFRESELPLHRTLLVAASNYWRKISGLRRCCGNTGHPGC